jgi:glutamate--cysteine ligase
VCSSDLRYLEMRGADSGPLANLLALSAFWVGILYDDASLDGAWDLVKHWTAGERQQLRDAVPKEGLAAMVRGRTLLAIAHDVLKLARAGLARRKHFDAGGQDETRYLEVLEDRLARGTTPAQELLDKFHGPWGGSVDPIYTEEAF